MKKGDICLSFVLRYLARAPFITESLLRQNGVFLHTVCAYGVSFVFVIALS